MTRFSSFPPHAEHLSWEKFPGKLFSRGHGLMVKRFALALVGGFLAASLLIGCGKTDTPSETTQQPTSPQDASKKPSDDVAKQGEAEAKKQQEEAKRAENLKQELTNFRTALLNNNYDGAKNALSAAFKLAPADPAVLAAEKDYHQAIEKRDAALKAAGTPPPSPVVGQQDEYQTRMRRGSEFIRDRRYDEAERELAAARLLRANDPTPQELMLRLKRQRDEELAARLQYQSAINARDYLSAGMALDRWALLAPPGDLAVENARRELQNLQTANPITGDHRKTAFGASLQEGNRAMADKRYDDAVRAFTYARDLDPTDATVRTLLEQAMRARDDLQRALNRFQRDMAKGQIDDAGRALRDAQRLAPNDWAVRQAQLQYDSARFGSSTVTPLPVTPAAPYPATPIPLDPATRKERLREYNDLVKQGKDAMKAKRYDDAVRFFTNANMLLPDEKEAANLLQQARAKGGTLTTSPVTPVSPGKTPQTSAAVKQYIATFNSHLKANRLDEAERVLAEARRLAPQDTQVQKAIRDLEKARKKPPRK